MKAIIFFAALLVVGMSVTVNIRNNCGKPISICGGPRINPRASASMHFGDHQQAVRITADKCGGGASLAEFSFGKGGRDWYDGSLIEGFNYPISIRGNCGGVSCPKFPSPRCYNTHADDLKPGLSLSCPQGGSWTVTFC